MDRIIHAIEKQYMLVCCNYLVNYKSDMNCFKFENKVSNKRDRYVYLYFIEGI